MPSSWALPIEDLEVDPDETARFLREIRPVPGLVHVGENAVKYGTPRSPITVSVSQGGGDVVVAVTNEGPTLTSAELEHVFDRFQRTESARRQGIPGVGLGLYITRSLVEAHGGRIVGESEPRGRITFRFTLPVAREPIT